MIHKVSHNMFTSNGSLIVTNEVINTPDSTNSSNSSNQKESTMDILAALASLLSKVQSSTANTQAIRADQNAQFSQTLVTALTNSINKIIQEVQAAAEAQAHQSLWDKITNAINFVVGAVLTVFGAGEIGIPMMIMSIANLTGLQDKVAGWLTDAFEALGISHDKAALMAQVTIAIAAFVMTMGASSEASIPSLLTATAMAFSMAPHLFADVYVVTHEGEDKADLEKEKAFLDMVEGICAALSAIAGAGLSKASSLENSTLIKGGKVVETAANTANAGSSAYYSKQLADIAIATGEAEANTMILKNAIKNNDNLATQEIKSFEQRMRADSQAQANLIQSISYLNCAKELSA